MLIPRHLELIMQYFPFCLHSVENKSRLVEAELHYLNGDIDLADASYKASIKVAREQKFIHELALAYELHGIFCVENKMIDEGVKQLLAAVNTYNEWGAAKKVDDVKLFIDLADPSNLRKLKVVRR